MIRVAADRKWVKRADRLATRTIACVLSYLIGVWPLMAQPNVIVPDGRTQTQLQTSGAVTNITTSTVSGPNGFNSFSKFGVGSGNTVNLQLPSGTQNLINLVRDAPAYVNGTLNAYKDGRIGGNVYFADPYGFVVGRSGVVNVGSLNVSTPTREFVDGVISPSGQINQGAVNNLLAGTVPISPDGNIRIRGRVNAVDAVRLTGQNVFVGGNARDAANREHAVKFASTVNSRGLRSANGIVVRNGSIQIVAANDAKVNGRLRARHGGKISVAAGRDVSIGSKARVSADNRNGPGGAVNVTADRDIVVSGYGVLSAKSLNGDAGTVRVIAGRSLTVEAGALFDASSAQGNAGLVELSSFGTFQLAQGFKVNVDAPNGRAGTLLVDPPDYVIGDSGSVTMNNAAVAALVSAESSGTLVLDAGQFTLNSDGVIDTRKGSTAINLVINATGSITIDGVIDARSYAGARIASLLVDAATTTHSTANSGAVTLNSTGGSITISSTGKIFAEANNTTGVGATTYTGGAVVLASSRNDTSPIGITPTNAVATISIAGEISGDSITATSNATAVTSYSSSAGAMATFVAGLLVGALAGVNGGYVKSEATSKVTLETTADLHAAGAVKLASMGSETAEDPVIAVDGVLQNSVSAGVVVGIVNADVQTEIKSGAKVASGNLSVLAGNDSTLKVSAVVFSTSTSTGGTFAYSTGTVNTKALIDPGASISKVGDITVAAQNQAFYSTSATTLAGGTGTAAASVAYSDVKNNAVANLGAGIAQAAGAGAISVYSGNSITNNAVQASSTVGSPYLLQGMSDIVGSGGVLSLFAPSGLFDSTSLKDSTDAQGTTQVSRGGFTLSLSRPVFSSSASIAAVAPDGSGAMVASGSGPNITASGNVGIISLLSDTGVRGDAATSIQSTQAGTSSDPSTTKGISMAVAVTEITESSNAYIGSGVTLSAARIGLTAQTTLPITNTWLNFTHFKDVTQELSDLLSHANGDLGIVNNILTTYANATADSQSFGFSGSVNYFDVKNNTVAWVGSGANLTTTAATGCATTTACWSSALTLTAPNIDLTSIGANSSYNWGHDVEITAGTTTQSIDMGGNFSWLTFFGTNSQSNPNNAPGKSIGGSANVNIFETNTVAGIGAGAVVTTGGTLDVSAKTSDLIYAVSPTSGKGSGLGLNGIASVLQLENNTSASISKDARVTAGSVSVDAEQDISSFDVGGAVGYSKASGFGIVVALASMTASTSAFIGGNTSALVGTGLTADDSGQTGTGGFVSALNTSVAALSVGRLTTVAVAAEGSNNTPDPAAPDNPQTKPDDASFMDKVTGFFKTKGTSILNNIKGAYNGLTQSVSGPVAGGNSTAGAGSAAVDLTNIDTSATVTSATLKDGTGGNNSVSVQALNNTIIDTASGAAALAKGAPGTSNTVGIAGAVAVTISSDMTVANIVQSSVTAQNVAVQALAGGESTTLGLAISLTTSSGNSDQASASVSIAMVNSGVQAGIDTSTIGQTTGWSAGAVSIIADQKTNIGIGAGSLYGGFGSGDSNGLGVSLTYAVIGDPSSGSAVSAILSGSKVSSVASLTVEALDSARIASGAAVAGGGANSNGFSGSVVVNTINPTIVAEITTTPGTGSAVAGGITVNGDVIVSATGGTNSTLDTIISNAAIAANGLSAPTSDSGVDFSGAAVSPSSATGAAIIAVAGAVGFGKTNIGISVVANQIGTRHEALVDGGSVTSTGGVVSVLARDDSEIIGIAIGVGASNSSSGVAGNGSVAYNAINNDVIAQIGHGTNASDTAGVAAATVDAAAVSVVATDSAKIRGAAGAISLNLSGGNAVGLSGAVNQISTYVSAAIAGGHVTADNTLTDNSTLITGNLQTGSVLVSGSSTADIIGVAVGVAVSVGNSQPNPPTPSQNFASLVSALKPANPSSLTGGGFGGVRPPTPPPAPPASPSPPSTGMSGAGSLVLSTESTSVYSSIDKGANGYNGSIAANDNVLVLATNVDSISAYSGALSAAINAGKGLGASVVVNTINGTTSAAADNSTIDAHALGNAATIGNGKLANSVDPSSSVTPASDPSLTQGTQSINGIAVVARSEQSANTVSAVLSASSSGLAISADAVTNIMGGTTNAEAKSASLNTNLTSGQTSAVQVTASSASFANNLDLGIADSGSGNSGTIVLIINTMNRTTTAAIDNTNIGSSAVPAGQVGVYANAFQGTAGEAIGAAGAGGSGAITGSALTNLFQSTTTATYQHGTVYASGLSVQADGLNGFFAAVGGASVGGTAGIGATVLVATSSNTVDAQVGATDTATAVTLHLTGPLTVEASNQTRATSYVIVGAAGGSAGIGAQFSGIILTNNVDAELDHASLTNNSGNSLNGNVTVQAQETDSINPTVGGLAIGGSAGVGAAVNLVILKSSTAALISGGTITTTGDVLVKSNSVRDVSPITVSAGLGGSAGLAGTVGVVLIGSAANSDEMGVLNSGSGTLDNAGSASGTNVTGQATGTGTDGISAQIVGASVTARTITVNADSKVGVLNIVGALGVGLSGGFGAAVGFTEIDQKVHATTSGGSLTAGLISVGASAGDDGSRAAANTWSGAGGGGLYVGLGAAVAESFINNDVHATLGSTTDGGTNSATATVAVLAQDNSSIASHSIGFGGGIAAVGISIANAEKTSTVAADIASSTQVTNVLGVMVTASVGGLGITTESVAGGAGIVSGAGASATSKDSDTVTAEVGSSAHISASNGVLVYAAATPNVDASSAGVSVGAVGLGASVAIATVGLTVTADVGNSTQFTGGPLTVSAAALVPLNNRSADAEALAGGGGALLGAQGSYAGANNTSTVMAYGGTNVTLPNANVTISAQNDSSQTANALGIAVGWVGVGATVTDASSNATTQAYLDTGAVTSASNTGALAITATGNDTNNAKSTAGSGGVYAGAAAISTTETTSTMSATLKGNGSQNTLYFAGIGVTATHVGTYSADGDAFQASAIGASGGSATNTVWSHVTAEVGTNLIINSAANDMNVIASDTVNQTAGGARAGSGGVAAGAATLSSTTVTQIIDTKVDSGTIFSLNDDPSTSIAKINIEGYATLNTTDTVSLTAGGLFAGGGARSTMNETATITVQVDATELFSAGNIDIGSAAVLNAANNANANLYGFVTGAGASTDSSLTATQNVNIGSTRVEGWGLINIYAGQSGDGSRYSTVHANGTTVVYNQAFIPITAQYRGAAEAYDNTTLTLGAGSLILGANNIFIGATQGSVAAAGKGTNYNPYLELFSTENHDDHSDSNGSGGVVINGTVMAGIHNQEIITIGLNGAVQLASGGSPYALGLEFVSDPSQFNPVMSYNHQKIQYTITGGFSPYQQVLTQIAGLSGLTTTQVDAAITSNTQITALNDDADGTKQRQINTAVQQAPFASHGSGQVYTFGNILVSAGNVSILAKSISGTNGQVYARDSVEIGVENQGLSFLDLHKLIVTSVAGGHMNFTGSAASSTSTGVTFHSDLTGSAPLIVLNASYNRKDPNTGQGVDLNGQPLVTTPDIYFDGEVTNLSGLLSITNQLGSVVATQSMSVLTMEMSVPNGAFTFNGGAGTIYNFPSDVAAQWAGVEYRPTDTLTAVEAAATWLGTYGNAYLGGDGNYHPYAYYYSNSGTTFVSAPVTGYSNPNTIFTARLLSLAYNGGNLYSAIFLPMNGFSTNTSAETTTTAQKEGTSTSNVTLAGWQRHDYEDQAYGDGGHGGPFNCSGCNNYFQVIAIQDAAVQPKTATTGSAQASTISIGKAVILSAGVININGALAVGQSSNFSANIGTNALNAINAIKGDTTALADAKTAAAAGHYVDITGDITANGSDVRVGAQYNALTDQILLSSVVQGTGGYVYLNGKIISTSTSGSSQGQINVNGGAGTVTINNSTGVDLVTNTINTGVTAASVVEIVDQLKQKTTWYVYNAGASAGNQVTTYEANGVNNSGYQTAAVTGHSGPSGLAYNPLANQYYQWIDTTTLTRPVSNDSNAYGWVFSGVSANSPVYPYTRTTSLVSNVQQVANNAPTGQLQTANFQEVLTATGSSHEHDIDTSNPTRCCGTDFNGTWHQEIYDTLTLTMTNTVKASYAIGISFNGGGASTVNVASNSNIVLNGPINNLQGTTTVTASGVNSLGNPSSITVAASANNALVSGTAVTLTAPGGIGVKTTPVPVQVYGGALTADSTDSDIAIAATGPLVINHVKVATTHSNATTGKPEPLGSVYLSATGDINSATAFNANTPIVVGKSVEIDSSGGAVGAVSGVDSNGLAVLNNINPLVVQAWATTLDTGTTDGGLINSTSSTGAYFLQPNADVRIGAIASNGPVFLEALNGSIRNGQTAGGLTAEQQQYLESVWTSLELVNGSGGASIASYQSMISAAYRDYWQLRNLAFADGVTYGISALGTRAIGAQLIASGALAAGTDLTNPSTATQSAIQTEATNRLMKDQYLLGLKTAAQLGVPLDTLFGTAAGQTGQFQAAVMTSALNSALTTFDSGFSYVLPTNSALYTSLTSGSQWSLDQLRYTVSASANPANGVPPPSIASLPLNVSGRQVMLYAPNGSIGSLAAPETFSFTSASASNLTAAQKGLLSSAGPGQLTVVSTTDPNTGIITYVVEVSQQSLVIVSPLGPVSAKALDQIYLGSASDMLLGGIPTATFGPITSAQSLGLQTTAANGGSVRLDAVGSILGGVSGQVAISGNIANLTLIAETGRIGTAPAAGADPATNPNALLLALLTLPGGSVGPLDQAVAAQGIYLRQTSGDLILGNITSGQGSSPIQFAASGSIYAESQFTDRTVIHLAGSALDVRAGAAVGFNGGTLQPLQVKITGAITGTAAGDMTILSPASNMVAGASGTYGVLTSGGAMTLDTVAGAIAINADVTSSGLMQLLANGAITFADGTSADPVVAKSTGGAITLASATLTMGAYSVLDAAGILSVVTTGNATLGQLKSAASFAAAGNGPSIDIGAGGVAAGAILSNGDGQTNIVTTGAAARVALSGSAGIGTSSARIGISAPFLSATAAAGGIYLNAVADLHATLLSAVGGNVGILGSGALTLDSVIAGTAATAAGTFGADAAGPLVIGTATSTGTQTIHSGQSVTFTTLTATGITGDVGDIGVTADAGLIQGATVAAHGSASLAAATTNKGTSVTGTTGSVTLTGAGLIDWTTIVAGTTVSVRSTGDNVNFNTATSGGTQTVRAANNVTFNQITTNGIVGDAGDVGVTADTGLIQGTTVAVHGSASLAAATTNKGTSVTGTTGSVTLTGAGLIDWTTIAAGTTVSARSTGDNVNFDTATSGGTQTVRAVNNVTFNQITTNGIAGDVGDVSVIADTGLIQGTTVAAHGSASLAAATTNKGTSVTGTTGSVTLTGAGLIDWTTIVAGTTVSVRSTGDNVNFDTATSGGTQTIRAANNVTFNQITTNGIAGDVGDVGVTADTGLIQGTTVAAHGSASLAAATTNKGTTLTAATGSATLIAGGLIDWTTIVAGKTIDVHSTAAAINLGTATSGGSQTIHAGQNVTFGQLTATGIPGDLGNITVTSDHGSITGNTVTANGDASFNGGNAINVTALTAGSATLSTPHNLTLGLLSVYRNMTLGADIIDVTARQLPSVPPVPLHVTVTGYQGGVATRANLTIDPPQVVVDRLSIMDSTIVVDSPSLTISSGYVPGQMMLTTPAGQILLDNRSPAPVGGVNLQLYEPGGVFTMQQIGSANFSDTQVVYYDATISSTIINYGGGNFTGSSFVRDSLQDMRNGDLQDVSKLDVSVLRALYFQGMFGEDRSRGPIEVIGDGPAVNIEGLLVPGNGRKRLKNIHRTSTEKLHGTDFASLAYGK